MKPLIPHTEVTRSDDDSREHLSALVDGQPDALELAMQQWRDEPAARQNWHAYHLIGDVMRSEDLASSPARDAAFMAGFRERLAKEPVVLAPAAASVHRAPIGWRLPATLAAGFAAVACVLIVSRLGSDETPALAGDLAAASAAQTQAVAVRQLAAGQALITDPRLDEFLRAHQAAGGVLAAAAPGGVMRRVEVIVPIGAAR